MSTSAALAKVDLRPGDHVKTRYFGLVYHHAIIEDLQPNSSLKLIHFTQLLEQGNNDEDMEEPKSFKSSNNKFCIQRTNGACADHYSLVIRPLNPSVVLQRARSMIGSGQYNIAFSNCEHFCSWCISFEKVSMQTLHYSRLAGQVLIQHFPATSSLFLVGSLGVPIFQVIAKYAKGEITGEQCSKSIVQHLRSDQTKICIAGLTGMAVGAAAGAYLGGPMGAAAGMAFCGYAAAEIMNRICLHLQQKLFVDNRVTAVSEAMKILELEGTITPEKVRSAYLRLSRIHHPDRGGNNEDFVAIHAAYELIRAKLEEENERIREKIEKEEEEQRLKLEEENDRDKVIESFENAYSRDGENIILNSLKDLLKVEQDHLSLFSVLITDEKEVSKAECGLAQSERELAVAIKATTDAESASNHLRQLLMEAKGQEQVAEKQLLVYKSLLLELEKLVLVMTEGHVTHKEKITELREDKQNAIFKNRYNKEIKLEQFKCSQYRKHLTGLQHEISNIKIKLQDSQKHMSKAVSEQELIQQQISAQSTVVKDRHNCQANCEQKKETAMEQVHVASLINKQTNQTHSKLQCTKTEVEKTIESGQSTVKNAQDMVNNAKKEQERVNKKWGKRVRDTWYLANRSKAMQDYHTRANNEQNDVQSCITTIQNKINIKESEYFKVCADNTSALLKKTKAESARMEAERIFKSNQGTMMKNIEQVVEVCKNQLIEEVQQLKQFESTIKEMIKSLTLIDEELNQEVPQQANECTCSIM
jgi:curved DNA-binding protein CbpA